MANESHTTPQPEGQAVPNAVEKPRPTAAPLVLALGRQVTSANQAGVGLVSWYWHFVDGVWVVVFTVVYLVGR